MNYLAHAYLFPDLGDALLGNLMGDLVKGKQWEQFPVSVQKGIHLHRQVDTFTDTHPLILEASKWFRPTFRFSGAVFIDIMMDHFLAKDDARFEEQALKVFTSKIYAALEARVVWLTPAMNELLKHMKANDWLFHYRFQAGWERAILGMCRRYPVLGNGALAVEKIHMLYPQLETVYGTFFPALETYVRVSLSDPKTEAE